jgi:COMPASS component SWD3
VWRGHQGNLNVIKWDPAGSLLASCSEDEVIYLWSPKQNEAVKALKGHHASVNSIKWNNHPFQNHNSGASNLLGNYPVPIIASASRDNTIKIWDVEYGKCVMTL